MQVQFSAGMNPMYFNLNKLKNKSVNIKHLRDPALQTNMLSASQYLWHWGSLVCHQYRHSFPGLKQLSHASS